MIKIIDKVVDNEMTFKFLTILNKARTNQLIFFFEHHQLIYLLFF